MSTGRFTPQLNNDQVVAAVRVVCRWLEEQRPGEEITGARFDAARADAGAPDGLPSARTVARRLDAPWPVIVQAALGPQEQMRRALSTRGREIDKSRKDITLHQALQALRLVAASLGPDPLTTASYDAAHRRLTEPGRKAWRHGPAVALPDLNQVLWALKRDGHSWTDGLRLAGLTRPVSTRATGGRPIRNKDSCVEDLRVALTLLAPHESSLGVREVKRIAREHPDLQLVSHSVIDRLARAQGESFLQWRDEAIRLGPLDPEDLTPRSYASPAARTPKPQEPRQTQEDARAGARSPALERLAELRRERDEAQIEFDAAVTHAIQTGKFSERQIGAAAGVSGPAIAHRKKRLPARQTTTETQPREDVLRTIGERRSALDSAIARFDAAVTDCIQQGAGPSAVAAAAGLTPAAITKRRRKLNASG